MCSAEITVNKHTSVPWHNNLTLRDVLRLMKYTFQHIIITVNGVLIHHDAYEVTTVPENADVRIIHLIAGG